MSEIAIGRSGEPEGAFRPATVVLMLAVGILAFVGMLILGAYAPDLRSGRNGGAHALSNGATGFSGIVRLAQATGRNPRVIRNDRLLDTEDLVVLTPESGLTDLSGALRYRGTRPTLIVLPKWQTVPDRGHGGWVRWAGLVPADDPGRTLAPGYPLLVERHRGFGKPLTTIPDYTPPELRFTAPPALQTVSGKGLQPIVTDSAGRAVVARVGDGPLYVLADPDLLSNQGMASQRQAAAALALLDFLNATGAKSIGFDVTLNGLGHSPSPLRLAFDPPFLATTLAIAAALLLTGLQTVTRFGAPRRPERAIAFGKAALVDNAAALIRKARRETAFGARYAEMIRERAVALFRVPDRLRDGAIDAYLDQIGGSRRFSELAAAAGDARHRDDLLAAARALHHWLQEKRQ
ncbi:MAG: DUF4350 domain-containing protein [Sphingomonadales bacterium]